MRRALRKFWYNVQRIVRKGQLLKMQRRRFCFFDLDGTLADTDPDIRGAWKAALADLGLECPSFDEKFVAGPPIDEMTRILSRGRSRRSLLTRYASASPRTTTTTASPRRGSTPASWTRCGASRRKDA